jgi:hypothetical protein
MVRPLDRPLTNSPEMKTSFFFLPPEHAALMQKRRVGKKTHFKVCMYVYITVF